MVVLVASLASIGSAQVCTSQGQALEYYLADVEELRLAKESQQEPADPGLDWSDVRHQLLATD